MDKKVRIAQIFTLSGALVAFHVGSGFASGQELLQFFTAYGALGIFAVGVLVFLLLSLFTVAVMCGEKPPHKTRKNNLYVFYCGKIAGTVFSFLTPLLLFLTYVVMLSGSGAAAKEYFGVSTLTGRVVMGLLTMVTVLLGLDKLVKIVGKIGPVIIVGVVALGVYGIFFGMENMTEGFFALETIWLPRAAPNWWLSAVSYASFAAICGLPFISGLGGEINNKKEGIYSAVLGSGAFCLAALVMSFGLLCNVEHLYTLQVPTLYLARAVSPLAAFAFSLVLFAGVYTTAVPMLWSVADSLEPDTTAPFYKLVVCVLVAIAILCSVFPFNKLLGFVYPYIGYTGVVLQVVMILNFLFKKLTKKP
ncbi:MAG: hypothetical protein PHG02_05130 [Oscillospiraceae bacterium]|nr:hypothetical protein [Oscillospiraceae bacterium]